MQEPKAANYQLIWVHHPADNAPHLRRWRHLDRHRWHWCQCGRVDRAARDHRLRMEGHRCTWRHPRSNAPVGQQDRATVFALGGW